MKKNQKPVIICSLGFKVKFCPRKLLKAHSWSRDSGEKSFQNLVFPAFPYL